MNTLYNKIKHIAKKSILHTLPLGGVGGGLLLLMVIVGGSLTSCSDDMPSSSYYSFKGEMASDYMNNREQYSEFAEIVKVAGLMDQLSAYGHYTCFIPNNDAVDAYLAKKGITFQQLLDSTAWCDTIARTHIVDNMYAVSEMNDGTLPTPNLMKRNLRISHKQDTDNNSVVVINDTAQVYFALQDDSVENGLMQPVSMVLENSTESVYTLLANNKNAQRFAEALYATGLDELLAPDEDPTYNESDYDASIRYITGGSVHEVANPPSSKKYGFTLFVVPDDVLSAAPYGVHDLRGLYHLADSIYKDVYPNDTLKPGWKFENLKDSINPLRRFLEYHLLDRNVQGYNMLTVLDDVGVDATLANTTDWYSTMLPNTMMKVEHLINRSWVDGITDVLGDRYINRRYDNSTYFIKGVHVQPSMTDGAESDGKNGTIFYVDSVLAYTDLVQNTVQNCRIRMDFSTIFPEIATNNMRMNGDYKNTGTESDYADSESHKYGTNYFFPDGYLNGVVMANKSAYFIYRRPRSIYLSMHGDEMIAHGTFDITFNIPSVPFAGDWQIRLGFAAMNGSAPRGQVQVYFDGVACGIPINMDIQIDNESIYGSEPFPNYLNIRNDQDKREEDFKILKNKGYYRGPHSIFLSSDNNVNNGTRFSTLNSTIRKVLVTKYITPGVHTLRIRNVSAVDAANKEAMLDYLELVPKSVYGVTGTGNAEDDL